MFKFSKSILALTLFGAVSTSSAGESEITGSIAPELRLFAGSPAQSGQSYGSAPSVAFDAEYEYQSDDYRHTVVFNPFFRFDPNDKDREHGDVHKLSWLYEGDDWEVKAGLDKVFWGVVESNHLVDVINQTDLVENLDGEDKLGQPMIQFATIKDWGTLRAFVLPMFRDRTYAGPNGRLRAPLHVDVDRAQHEDGNHVDTALRYEHVVGDWDVGVAHFSGTSREPVLRVGQGKDGENVLIPTYYLMDQTSVDLQLTTESVLYKLEAFTRETQDERFEAVGGGVEYTLYGIYESDKDLGLIAEYHYDNRPDGLPSTSFDNDVFLAARLAFNDVNDAELLAGVLVDTHSKDKSFSVEYNARVGEDYKLEVESTIFMGRSNAFADALNEDDFVTVRLTRYF